MTPTRSLRFLLCPALLAGLYLALCPAPAHAQKRSDAVVKATASADKPNPDGKQVVTITLTIDKGWHLYANPVGLSDLEEAQTVVTISGKVKPDSVKIDYPAGTLIKDKVVGDFKVYEDKVVIKATVTRAKGDTAPLEASIKLQACDERRCLLPATLKVSVP